MTFDSFTVYNSTRHETSEERVLQVTGKYIQGMSTGLAGIPYVAVGPVERLRNLVYHIIANFNLRTNIYIDFGTPLSVLEAILIIFIFMSKFYKEKIAMSHI